MSKETESVQNPLAPGPVSRRSFLKGIGATTVAAGSLGPVALAAEVEKLDPEKTYGPGAVPISLKINGEVKKLSLEPRVTLLDALRNHLPLTGSKEVCDRATCGACTVLLNGTPAYACMTLAIEAQGADITTIEGLAPDGKLSPIQEAFVSCDALMCGFCTPGFVMSLTALVQKNPRPDEAAVKKACSGNLCRCGTYPKIFQAALKAVGVEKNQNVTVIPSSHASLA